MLASTWHALAETILKIKVSLPTTETPNTDSLYAHVGPSITSSRAYFTCHTE